MSFFIIINFKLFFLFFFIFYFFKLRNDKIRETHTSIAENEGRFPLAQEVNIYKYIQEKWFNNIFKNLKMFFLKKKKKKIKKKKKK